jgi:hypothetical protein
MHFDSKRFERCDICNSIMTNTKSFSPILEICSHCLVFVNNGNLN